MRGGSLILSVALLMGCSSSGTATDARGVDKLTQHRAVCKNMITTCYVSAGTICRGDYNVVSKVDVLKSSNSTDGYREFTVFYRCK